MSGLERCASQRPPTLGEIKEQFAQLDPLDQLMTKKGVLSK